MDWLIALKTCSALNASWALRGSGAPTAFVVAPVVRMFSKTAAEPAFG